MNVTVLITTYNKPWHLERALTAFACQDLRDFDVVVADDGSDPQPADVIEASRSRWCLPIRHVRHEHDGFRKTAILNKALATLATDYVIFTDDDCIVRSDFVRVHVTLARKGRFLSGGVVHLPAEASADVTLDDIATQRVFGVAWHTEHGLAPGIRGKVGKSLWAAELMDHVTTTKASFNGHNSSAWRTDIVAVNGFDERLGYGGLDRELGERLVNAGVRGLRIRYRAIALHLHHQKQYLDPAAIARNRDLRREVRRGRRTWTAHGLVKGSEAARP